ncbi:membrane protein insertase YidC [Mumia sp. zg.B53]|uniref:membrane protein insertase YidC n=1 Tax=unclassified Mumia TaxID=2621872 RepID=UPI001C6E3A5B|nr:MULTISPECIES: membrane protein insertase YidC [unclassified Mumia]MBW9207725.1 membrane protein insertase YidC [Mumia sp. zg.B17]MBW9209929.1 membrane protein insertase YidC [Mumia sp. zg.B21]MBW9214533.1 membrane protein insertase YidC [Mumia sp. zg.B53]MDD9347654.1 membrane protein insertase YidC [Mumia sp.]
MFSAIGDFFDAIMQVLYYPVSAIMVGWHWLFTKIGMDTDSGWTWALSIIGLTVTIRMLLIPLFVKQIKASRNMQILQPKIRELQKKYGHDRERMAQEQMKLFREAKTNPFASCLPLILQMPIFFALFRVINGAAGGKTYGVLSQDQADSIREATFLGVQIASRFTDDSVHVKIVCAVLVVLMTASTFLTQRQLMSKNMPADALTGPYAQQQKLLLYVLPFVFAISGVAFPVGVLIYWTTSNAWTMGQQFYVIRNNPAPGTPAFEAKQQRDTKRGKVVEVEPEAPVAEEKPGPRRQQPKKQSREQRKKGSGPRGESRPGDASRGDESAPGEESGQGGVTS